MITSKLPSIYCLCRKRSTTIDEEQPRRGRPEMVDWDMYIIVVDPTRPVPVDLSK